MEQMTFMQFGMVLVAAMAIPSSIIGWVCLRAHTRQNETIRSLVAANCALSEKPAGRDIAMRLEAAPVDQVPTAPRTPWMAPRPKAGSG